VVSEESSIDWSGHYGNPTKSYRLFRLNLTKHTKHSHHPRIQGAIITRNHIQIHHAIHIITVHIQGTETIIRGSPQRVREHTKNHVSQNPTLRPLRGTNPYRVTDLMANPSLLELLTTRGNSLRGRQTLSFAESLITRRWKSMKIPERGHGPLLSSARGSARGTEIVEGGA